MVVVGASTTKTDYKYTYAYSPAGLGHTKDGALVRTRVDRKDAATRIAAWSKKEIDPDDRQHFAEIVEADLTGLHEGNFARYRIRPAEFAAWRKVWETR